MTANSPNPGGDSLTGCLAIFIVLVMLALWQYTLSLALLVGICYGFLRLIRAYSKLFRDQQHAHRTWRLGRFVRGSGQALVGRFCCYRDQYYLIDAVSTVNSATEQMWIHLSTRGLAESAGAVSVRSCVLKIEGPGDYRILRSSLGLISFLEESGLQLIDEMSVVCTALRASFDCLEQANWSRAGLKQISALEVDLKSTLTKAKGNELLEPSIPQLQDALASCGDQREKLSGYIDLSIKSSKKLYDYLAVPEGVRSIINFDVESLIDFSAFKDLEDSFNEVVAINDAFRDLNRDRII